MKRTAASTAAITLAAALIMVFALLLVMHFKKRGATREQFVAIRERTLKGYAAFDKVYIPALVLTNQGKVEESRKAMKLLNQNWEPLASKHYAVAQNNIRLQRNLNKIQTAIRTADKIVDGGENLKDAHELLETIRFILMEIRRNNLTLALKDPNKRAALPRYYIDYLTEFHEPMEAIVLTAKGKTPETLTDEDVAKIKEELAEASKLLITIENVEFEQSIYGFSDEETETMRGYIKQETESLDKLRKALEGKDEEKIIRASIEVKPVFVKLFTMFGDFESLK